MSYQAGRLVTALCCQCPCCSTAAAELLRSIRPGQLLQVVGRVQPNVAAAGQVGEDGGKGLETDGSELLRPRCASVLRSRRLPAWMHALQQSLTHPHARGPTVRGVSALMLLLMILMLLLLPAGATCAMSWSRR